MKVFISWSGERSKKVAELLDDWIQCVIQAVDPWMSSKDIDRGALWFSEISDQLANTSIGVICLTKENKNKPWILFESGALAKGLSSNRVCTFLIDLLPSDLQNPLAQFNHTFPNKESVWELVQTINLTLKDKKLKESILSKVFDTYWEQFENSFNEIIKNTLASEVKEERKEDEILVDVLNTVRSLEKQIRNIESNSSRNEVVNILNNAEGNRNIRLRRRSNSISNNQILNNFLLLGLKKEEIIERFIRRGLNIEEIEELFNNNNLDSER